MSCDQRDCLSDQQDKFYDLPLSTTTDEDNS